jgi:plasmid stabilization system protein ParE
MKIVYSRRALRDIDEILAYIRKRSPRGAHKVSRAIEHKIHICALNPRGSPETDESDVYRCPLGKYRYTIFYRALASAEGIEVVRVVHGGRVRNLRKVPDEE